MVWMYQISWEYEYKLKMNFRRMLISFWPSTSYSDFLTDQTFNQFHEIDTELDLPLITSGFHGAFAKGVACQQWTLTLQDN